MGGTRKSDIVEQELKDVPLYTLCFTTVPREICGPVFTKLFRIRIKIMLN